MNSFPKENSIRNILNRTAESHKGDYGRAFCVVGSYGMAGAGIISGLSCLRCGVGICDICLEERIYPIVGTRIPEAVFSVYSNAEDLIRALWNGVEKATAVLVGCGCKNTELTEKKIRFLLTNTKVPLIIDADGINVLKKHIDVMEARQYPTVITPHLAEMARLTNNTIDYVKKNKLKVSKEFAKKYNTIVVLKDHHTLVVSPQGDLYENTATGNPGMATGGSGDMLAGMITSFASQGYDLYDSAVAGVYLHGLAGDFAKEEKTVASMLPTDMIEMLPKVFKTIK